MSNKRRVYVSIHHRDELSLGQNRVELQYSAFHWSILIAPKKSTGHDCFAIDVSDGVVLDPVARQDLNPDRNWIFRSRQGVNPLQSGHLIGRVLIGKVPKNITDGQIKSILATVPLPIKNATPQQNCVTWTMAAIDMLQEARIARGFDVSQFFTWALSQADNWMVEPSPLNIYDYAA